jgi:hypothetical protein
VSPPVRRRGLTTVEDFWVPVFSPDPNSVLPTPLLPGLIHPGIWFLAGKDKLGKTILGQALALTLATGHSFLGLEMLSGPQKVVYIDEQLGAAVMDMRFAALLEGQGDPALKELARTNLSRLSLTGFRFDAKQPVVLEKFIDKTKPAWIFFDPLITLATWKQLEHTDEGAELSNYLAGLYHQRACSLVLFIHSVKSPRRGQTRPSEWALSSFELRFTASGWLGLTEDKQEKRWVTVQSNLLGLDHSFGVDWYQEGPNEAPTLIRLALTPDGEEAAPDDPQLKELEPWALHLKGVSVEQIGEALGYSSTPVPKKVRDRVKRAKWVEVEWRREGHNKKFYAPASVAAE